MKICEEEKSALASDGVEGGASIFSDSSTPELKVVWIHIYTTGKHAEHKVNSDEQDKDREGKEIIDDSHF
jgi:hypothetical protein